MSTETDDNPPHAGAAPETHEVPKSMKKKVILATVAVLLIGAGAAAWFVLSGEDKGQEPTSNNETQQGQAAKQDDGKLRIIASGDMIAHDSINANAKQTDGSYDYLSLMSDMKPFFDKADVRFCNQATPAGGEFFGITGYPVFNAPFAFTTNLVKLGCNVVNIGTNHTNDKGQRLIDATVDEWSKQDVLAYAGANRSSEEQNKVPTFEREGVKFAFLSYTTYSNTKPATSYGINMYNAAKAKTQLAAARKAADIVIVSMRWGTEYSAEINFEQNKIAQDLADFGADIVLGHGPHVLQPVKRLKANGRETIVWFSLGNFLNSQIDIESLVGGLAIMDVDTATKKVTSVSFLPVYQHYEWTAAEKKREDLLTRHNFMMVPLDGAAGLLAKSQHSTTVEAQAARVKSVLNDFTAIPIINSSQY